MKIHLNRWYGTAAVGLVIGLVLGFVVGSAMSWEPRLYLRFIGFLALAAFVTAMVWAYRTYLRPAAEPVVERKEVDTPS
jgi:protein-S-isoprenylcysteine O-methyltransferase Ste14